MTGIDANGVARWFARYVETFGACGRGDCDFGELMTFYGVPLLLTSDEGLVLLETAERIEAAIMSQIDGLRAAGYHHSELVNEEVTMLNLTSALYRASFSWVGHNGEQLRAAAVTYLITDGDEGLRISVLAAHSR